MASSDGGRAAAHTLQTQDSTSRPPRRSTCSSVKSAKVKKLVETSLSHTPTATTYKAGPVRKEMQRGRGSRGARLTGADRRLAWAGRAGQQRPGPVSSRVETAFRQLAELGCLRVLFPHSVYGCGKRKAYQNKYQLLCRRVTDCQVFLV